MGFGQAATLYRTFFKKFDWCKFFEGFPQGFDVIVGTRGFFGSVCEGFRASAHIKAM